MTQASDPAPVPAPRRILGIDTSCDDTGVGLVEGGRVVANLVASQAAMHASFGGIVPEAASRGHLGAVDGLVGRALAEAGWTLDDLDAVAATRGPGLVGALLVGLQYAKGLAWARGLPFVPVHHLEGHVASAAAAEGAPEAPFLCLIASGGHTVLFDVPADGVYVEVGRSLDDAAGEAFDKVARLLGLPYPGGPALARLAEEGDDRAVPLPVPLQRRAGTDFSFSGLKTAVAVYLEGHPDAEPRDVAASFERVAVESLVRSVTRAAEATGRRDVIVAGGVAANRRLRARMAASGLRSAFPPPALATDNGAMIALAAERMLRAGLAPDEARGDALATDAAPYLPLDPEGRGRPRGTRGR